MKDANQHNEPVTNKMFDKNSGNKTWKTTAIVAIVVALLLSAVGVFGYLQIKKLNKQVQDQKAQITELSDTKKTLEDAATAAASAVTNAVTNTGFVEVKELGFKLPVGDDLKDLQYFVNDKTVFFSTKTLMSSAWGADSSDPAKYCSPGALPLGAITRFGTAADAGPTQQKVLAGFVLGYALPQASCSNNSATTTLQNKQKASLLKAFESAQKI